MKNWKERIIRFAIKNRKSPTENRRLVGKNLSLLAVFLFAVFLVNFAVIIGTGSKFGVDLVKEASRVHQTTRTVPAKRGTIYDRNGTPIAEDAVAYEELRSVDKYMTIRFNQLVKTIRDAYADFEFLTIYKALVNFINAYLSV